MKAAAAPARLLRTDLGGSAPDGAGAALLSLLVMSDVQVVDTVSPARCEWVELRGEEPLWQPLLHMHRPYEALTHWSLAAHVQKARARPFAPGSSRPFDLALCLGDNIDNAQRNELDAFLAILAGGRAQLSARGGVHEPSDELGPGPWPYWCPQPGVADLWKPRGYPAVEDFVARAGAPLVSEGLGFAWSSLPGNHDLLRQGTALPEPRIEAIAVGSGKGLCGAPGFAPADPLSWYVQAPADFSAWMTRRVAPLATRRAVDRAEWIAAHVAHGASGLDARHVRDGCCDTVIETPHASILLLDTNHPAGDYEGSIGTAQLQWLDAQLDAVDRQRGRFAVLASHHGAVSLTNRLGADPQRLQADALLAVAHRHPCVAAWLVGHRHLHAVRPHPGPSGGFWEISTGAVIDWPTQVRTVEFLRHRDGGLEIACTLQDHDAPPDSLAHLHQALARRFAGAQAARMQGGPGDGNVRLMLPARAGSRAA